MFTQHDCVDTVLKCRSDKLSRINNAVSTADNAATVTSGIIASALSVISQTPTREEAAQVPPEAKHAPNWYVAHVTAKCRTRCIMFRTPLVTCCNRCCHIGTIVKSPM